MITHFPKNPMMNVGGVFSFSYTPVHLVARLPKLNGKFINEPIELVPGNTMLNGYSTLEELDFKETQKEEENGPYYQFDINGFIPGDSSELIELIEEMENVRHLVIIRDNLNQQRVVGYNAPLSFRATFQTGTKPGEARGYRYAFTALSVHRSPVFKLG